jgi:hypothetical protein
MDAVFDRHPGLAGEYPPGAVGCDFMERVEDALRAARLPAKMIDRALTMKGLEHFHEWGLSADSVASFFFPESHYCEIEW